MQSFSICFCNFHTRPRLQSHYRKFVSFISSLSIEVESTLQDCFCKENRFTNVSKQRGNEVGIFLLKSDFVCGCVCMSKQGDNFMQLHAMLERGRMSLIYNHDERSVHLIKQHIGILQHSIG